MTVPAPAAESGDRAARAHGEAEIRHNFVALLVHGMLGQTGFRLLQAPTFLPAYLSLLSGGNTVVGVARAVQSLGMALSPWIGAWIIEQRTRVKGLALLFGGAMRFQVLLLALTALLLPRQWALLAVWVVVGGWGFAAGLQMVTFNFILSKTIPAHRRGRLLGLRNATSGVTLLLLSAAGGWLLERFGYPDGYGWTFLLAFVLTSLGLLAFARMREPDTLERRLPSRLLRRLAELPRLLEDDPDFRRFVVARFLGTAGRAALPFYILYVAQQAELTGTRLALLTIVYTVAESQGALLWGLLSDRTGFRVVLLSAIGCWAAGNVLVLGFSGGVSAVLVFLLVGAGYGGFLLSSQNLVLEFGTQADRAMRIAATNATAEAVGMVAYLAAGFASDVVPLQWIFAASLVLQAGTAAALLRVRDPRFRD